MSASFGLLPKLYKTPQPLQIKFNRGINVRGRSVVSSEGHEQNEAAAGVALTTNSNNGVNVNRYNDDNANDNLVVALSPNFCLSFFSTICIADGRFLSLLSALYPTAKHTPNLIELFLKRKRFLLSDSFDINTEAQENAKHIDFSTYRYKL